MPKLPRSTSSATSSMASETIPSRPAKPHPDRLKIMHLFPDRPLGLDTAQPRFAFPERRHSLESERHRVDRQHVAGEKQIGLRATRRAHCGPDEPYVPPRTRKSYRESSGP